MVGLDVQKACEKLNKLVGAYCYNEIAFPDLKVSVMNSLIKSLRFIENKRQVKIKNNNNEKIFIIGK